MPFDPSSLNGTLEILTPAEALEVEKQRGEWAAIAAFVNAQFAESGYVVGAGIRTDALGLTDEDFGTDDDGNLKVGGLRGALRQYGLKLTETVDESFMVKVPVDREARIEKHAASIAAATAKREAAKTAAK